MAFIQVELDAISASDLTADLLGLSGQHVLGGLVKLWAWAWKSGVDVASEVQVAGCLAVPMDKRQGLVAALEAGGFVESLGGGMLRIRGAKKYLRISQARSAAGKKGAAASGRSSTGQFTGNPPAIAGQVPSKTPALTPITDHRSPRTEEATSTDSSAGADARPPVSDAGAPVEPAPPSLAPGAPVPIQTSLLPTVADVAAATPEPDPVEVALATWNRLALPEYPRARLTATRRPKIRAALKLVPLEDWPKAIEAVNAWTWRGPDGTWKPDLDWLLGKNKQGADNIVRAVEGALGGKPKVDARKGPVRAEDVDWSGQKSGVVSWDEFRTAAGLKPRSPTQS